jgi:hypothetical protein
MDKLRELTPLPVTFFSGERPTDEKLEGMMRQVAEGFDFVEATLGDLYGDGDSPALWTTNIGRDLGNRSKLNPVVQPDIFVDSYVQSLTIGKMEHELDLIPVGSGSSILTSSADSSVVISQYKSSEELLTQQGDWTIRPGKLENGINKNSRKLITHSPSSGGSIIFNQVTSGKGSTYHGSRHNLIPSLAQAQNGGPFLDIVVSNALNNIYTVTTPMHLKEFDEINNASDVSISNIAVDVGEDAQYELPSYFFDADGLDLLSDDELGAPKDIPLNALQLWDWDAKQMVTGLEKITCSQNASARKFQFTMQFRPDIILDVDNGNYVLTASGTTIYEMLGAIQKELIFHNHDGDDQVRYISHRSLMGLRTGSANTADASSYYGPSSIDNNDHSMYFHRNGYTVGDIGGGGNVIRGDVVVGSSVVGAAADHENYNLLQDSKKIAFGKLQDGGEFYFDKIKTHVLPESRGNLPSSYSDASLIIKGAKSDFTPGLHTTLIEGNLRVDSDVVLGTTSSNDVFVTGDLYVYQSLTLTPKTNAEIALITTETGKQIYSTTENAPLFWNGVAWVNPVVSGYSILVGDGVKSFGKYNGSNASTIQSAIDELELKGGGKILLQKGTYTLGATAVQLKSNVQIEGEGVATIIASTSTAFNIASAVSNSSIKNLKIQGATIGVVISGSYNTLDTIDATLCTQAYSQTGAASFNTYGDIKLSSFLIHSGESNPVFATSNKQTVTVPAGYAGPLKAVDWCDKQSLLSKLRKVSGGGSLVYEDSTDSYLGRGRYAITGTGTWIVESFIPVARFLGIGGSVAHRANLAGGTVTVGVQCYDASFADLGNNGGFLVNLVNNTTSWDFKYNYARLEGALASNLKTDTKFVKIFITIGTNPGTTYLDALEASPMGYSAFALYF